MGKISRKSTSSQIWDRYVGPSRDAIPWSHLPTQKIVLQRFRGIRSSSETQGDPGYKSKCLDLCWEEIQDIWRAARNPTVSPHNGKRKLQRLVLWFDGVTSNKRYLESSEDSERPQAVHSQLLQLFDVAPQDLEVQMKTSLNKDTWRQDHEFYMNQKAWPQTMTMEGIDARTSKIEKRRAERMETLEKQREKEEARKETEFATADNTSNE
jgi:hypothetical protein